MNQTNGHTTPPDRAAASEPEGVHHPKPETLLALAIGSIGVVYGDIGTSPLYAFREALAAAGGHGGPVARADVIGVLSLILWALILVVTIKYVLILLYADNNGEGGTLSLMALVLRVVGKRRKPIIVLGVIGAAMFYGDSVITPAISVLSAVEGLKIVTPQLEPFIMPITIVILIGLFAVQSRGTAKVAAFFGPIMVMWFVVLAALGISHINDDLGVFAALNPVHGVIFMLSHGKIALITFGAVFLAVTGGEALYADLGHFGRKPIQGAWMFFVFPALALNYLGQGALVLSNPDAITNPFYLLAPEWGRLPLVILATAATVIASQAVITGAFSLTRQAIQLGLLPRLEIRHTSESHAGQIYMPRINALLLIGVLTLVVVFKTSSNLASAYGIAVTTTMIVDATLVFFVIWRIWNWNVFLTALVVGPLMLINYTFFAANLMKVIDGGWAPLLMGGALMIIMWTWRRGTRVLADKTRRVEVPMTGLLESLEKRPPVRVKGTAVFLTGDPEFAPASLLHNLKHNKVLHEKNIVMTISTADTPRVPDSERLKLEPITDTFWKARLTFGYMEQPSVPRGLALMRRAGLTFDIMATSFFLSRRSLKASPNSGMPMWQDKLFIMLARSANDATDFFQIPTNRVVEVGTQVSV